MIDSHVHLRDGILSQKETIAHGCQVAYNAGFTAFFDMPNTNPPLTSFNEISLRIKFADNVLSNISRDIFYGVYGGITSSEIQIKEIVKAYNDLFPRIVGLKMFAGHSTGKMGIIEKEEQRNVYKRLAALKYTGVLAIHCEKESLLHNELFDINKPATHSIARPPIAEIESIKDQIELAQTEKFSGHIHICHISTKEGIEIVNQAKRNGVNISCGATGHHALLNTEAYNKQGVFVKMNPPLRDKENMHAVFNGLLDGKIDWIESDHAPHTIEDKYKGASGIPSFSGSLLLIKKLRQAGCSEKRLKELCGETVNKIFNLNLKFNVPSDEELKNSLPAIRAAYPYDAFQFV